MLRLTAWHSDNDYRNKNVQKDFIYFATRHLELQFKEK